MEDVSGLAPSAAGMVGNVSSSGRPSAGCCACPEHGYANQRVEWSANWRKKLGL